jgi:hypothetical protein
MKVIDKPTESKGELDNILIALLHFQPRIITSASVASLEVELVIYKR